MNTEPETTVADQPAPPADAPSLRDDPQSRADGRAWLTQYTRQTTAERDAWAGREARASWARLVVFGLIIGMWVVLAGQPSLATGASAVLLVLFAVAVRRHQVLRQRREQLDRCLTVAQESEARYGGTICQIRDHQRPEPDDETDAALEPLLDSGPTWTLTAQEIGDLDLFDSPVGVFGLLNRTSTAIGARRLASMLTAPLLDAERIAQRQQAVRWLAEHTPERITLLAACAALRDEDARLARLVRAIRSARPLEVFPSPAVLRIWSIFTGIFSLIALALAVVGQLTFGGLLGAVLVVNAVIFVRLRRQLVAATAPWRDVAWAIRGYREASAAGAQHLPAAGSLGVLRDALVQVAEHHLLERLSRRVGWTESGGLMALLMNLVVLADLHVAGSIVKRVVPRRAALLRGLSALAELEALASLAAMAWEQPITCFPQPTDQPCIRIRGGVHPLVDPQRVVANDVELNRTLRFWIVTGSNMAGKSTLLRMIGLNVLLAQTGAAALAREMVWRPVRLMTDLRASDNLARNESYFLAEVRHLRRMVNPPPGDVPLLGLIDEPFRGTNSEDQTAASVAVVQHLLASGNLFVLATHDRYLTLLADGEHVRNYHFRENLGSDGMVFDYRLHDGPATTRNALRILEQEGYPPSLMEIARKWHSEHLHEGA